MTIVTIGQLGAALLAANFVVRPIVNVAMHGMSGKFNLYTRENKDGTRDSAPLPNDPNQRASRHDISIAAKALGLTPKELVKTLSIFAAIFIGMVYTGGLTIDHSLSLKA